jgi:hypothetical protein
MMQRLTLMAALMLVLGPAAGAQSGEWKQLFNGKDLTGWKHVGPGRMVVTDGVIETQGGMGLLYWAGGKIGNAVVRIVFKMRDANDNSGVFIRIPEEPADAWMPVNRGYEIQIDNQPEKSGENDYHVTGCLYSINKALARPGKGSGEWNTLEVTLDGLRTIVAVNGVKVTDVTEGRMWLIPPKWFDFEPDRGPRPAEGYFGLQNHGPHDVVFFKEVAIRPLSQR